LDVTGAPPVALSRLVAVTGVMDWLQRNMATGGLAFRPALL
jgi:hypothetical protein